MKKMILLLTFISSIIFSFAQRMDTAYMRYQKEDFIRRSTVNKRTGNIFLGGGLAAMTIGFVTFFSAKDNENALIGGSTTIGMGFMSSLISIPFYVISSSYSHRALMINAQIKIEKNNVGLYSADGIQPVPWINNNNRSHFPAISLKVNLGK